MSYKIEFNTNKEQTLQGRQVIAQGSVDYNAKTFAYVVSKDEINYFVEIGVVNGAKQSESEKKELKFEQQKNGKFYLNKKDFSLMNDVFIEEKEDLRSLIFYNVAQNSEMASITANKDGTLLLNVMGKSVKTQSNIKDGRTNTKIGKLNGIQKIVADKISNAIIANISNVKVRDN
ncbi:MAG TPA: hypothetical protein VLL98_01605 [Rickettsiales bacterium]|nr:hypothetical protein [Rickettsiales bacterium]